MHVGIMVSDGVDSLRQVDTALLRSLGFTGVFVACYEDEVRWHAEDLAAFVRRVKADGLEPYAVPWGYGRVTDPDPSIESLYVRTHLDACQQDSRGRRLQKACPNNPRFLEWFSSSMRTLAWLLECRGFLWDEPGFHHARGAWSCHCPYCARLFQASYGRPLPHELTDEALEFRRNSINLFVLAAAAAIQAVDRRLRSFLMPSPRTGRDNWFPGNEDAAQLAGCSGVDALCSLVPWHEMGWDMEYGVREFLAGPARVAHESDKPCILWLTASPGAASRTADAVIFAARSGVDSVVLSDYDSLIRGSGFGQFRGRLQEALRTATGV
jgi:hypothetical protein